MWTSTAIQGSEMEAAAGVRLTERATAFLASSNRVLVSAVFRAVFCVFF